MRDTTRTLGFGLVAVLLAVSAGFAGVGAMASGGTTGNQTNVANQTTAATNQTTTTNATGNAQVRVAHLSPDAPPVDVLVDNATAVSNLSYGNVTNYTSLPAGEHNVTITAAGDPSAVVFSGNETFNASTNYTVAATGLVAGNGTNAFEPVVYEDNFTAPGRGNASVRLVHEALGAGPVDVTVKGTNTTLFDNVSFRNATAYKQLPAGDYTLEVRHASANDTGTVLKTFNVSLKPNTVYSAFAAGYVDHNLVPQGRPDRPFDLILVTDFTARGNGTAVAQTSTATTTPTTTATTTSTSTATTTPTTTATATRTASTSTMTTPKTTSTNATTTTSMNTTTAPPTNQTTTAQTTTPENTTSSMNTETATASTNATMETRTSTSENVPTATSSSESAATSTSANPMSETSTSEGMTETTMADETGSTSTSA